MAGRRVLWGILLAGALGLYLFANSAGTLCVLLAAALPLLSAVSLLLPRQITLTLSAPETVGRGEQMTCTLTVSTSGIPAQFELTVEAENSFTGEYSTRVMPLSIGKKPASLSWQLAETHSGVVRLSCTSVREFDSFGLFSRKRICTAQTEVLLPPQTFPVSVCLNQAAEVLLDSESYSAQKAGNDPGETFRIREYVPGDPIRQIHWKLSEKMGTLMVREFGLPAMNRLLLAFLPERHFRRSSWTPCWIRWFLFHRSFCGRSFRTHCFAPANCMILLICPHWRRRCIHCCTVRRRSNVPQRSCRSTLRFPTRISH